MFHKHMSSFYMNFHQGVQPTEGWSTGGPLQLQHKLDNAKRGIPSQGGKIDLDPKSIGFLPSSYTTYMWSLIVIGLKL